jgi:hypothetical protein
MGDLEQLLAAGGTRGGCGRRRRDVVGRGKASGGRASEQEGQVVRVGRRGAAGSPGDRRRRVAGGAAEQQRGRGEKGR